MKDESLQSALSLARELGSNPHDFAILAEGNTSALIDESSFWVKASGFQMRGISEDGFVQVNAIPIREALKGPDLPDLELKAVLQASVGISSKAPSVETFMHAYLLSLDGVSIVGHTHPKALLGLLCLAEAPEIARQRLFPDEVVCCGPEACFVPYCDPGLPLARTVQERVEAYISRRGELPKTIWMANHGLIALGMSKEEVMSATLMSEKAAEVWLAALSSGRELRPMTSAQIDRIHHRPDEHYRQNLLWKSIP
jgi:rhamnose utilization protein RhaD (predicted bifunctional aldolase and dehydrogenase)